MWIRGIKRISHDSEGMCVEEKGDYAIAPRICSTLGAQFYPWLAGLI